MIYLLAVVLFVFAAAALVAAKRLETAVNALSTRLDDEILARQREGQAARNLVSEQSRRLKVVIDQQRQ